jgi:hypothetical protein
LLLSRKASPHVQLATGVSTSRRDRIWGFLVSQAAGRGGPVSAGDACVAAAAAAGATGAWLTAARDAEAGHLMRVTDKLSEQLGLGIADAFIRLRAYAYARDLRLTDVAHDIVARRLRLSSDPGPGQDGDA